MGVKVGPIEPEFLDDISHMWDPRNPKTNDKVRNSASSSTNYGSILGDIDGVVSDATMLNADGYLDFPTPAMTAATNYGSQYFVDLASTFNIDLWADSGYTIQVWVYINRPLIYNEENLYSGSDYDNTINILSEKGATNLKRSQFFLDGNYTRQQSATLQSTYDWRYYVNSISTVSYRNILQSDGANEVSSGAWQALTLTADKQGGLYPYTNFYVNASRIKQDKQVNEGDSNAVPQAIGTIGLDPTTGTPAYRPAMSFIGVMGPILTWNRELTYSQVVDSFANLYSKLPTPS
jgi:hypothetical protein